MIPLWIWQALCVGGAVALIKDPVVLAMGLIAIEGDRRGLKPTKIFALWIRVIAFAAGALLLAGVAGHLFTLT